MTLHGYSHPVNWFREITRQIEEEGDNKMKFPSIRQKLQDNPATWIHQRGFLISQTGSKRWIFWI